jgi:purine-cytosine permease-like protein
VVQQARCKEQNPTITNGGKTLSNNTTGSNEGVATTTALGQEVPDSEQMSRGSLAMAWYGVVSALFFVYIGAVLAVAYGSVNAIIGLVLAIIVYGVINSQIAKYALNNRTTVAQFSRTILGSAGSAIATIIFALVAVYYAVFEGLIVAIAFQTYFGGELWVWILVVVIYSTPLVMGGARRFLDKLNGWLLPFYWAGLIAAVIWAGVQYGVSDTWITQGPEIALPFMAGGPGWLATFAAYLGVMIMMMFVMDYASLGRKADMKFHRTITFGWVFYVFAYGVNALVGIWLVFTITDIVPSETGIAQGIVGMMGILGVLLIFISQTRINTANYYLSSVNLQSFVNRVFKVNVPYWIFVIIAAIIIFLIMLLPVLEYILLALAWQGVLVTAWVGITLAHILMTKADKGERGNIDDSNYRGGNGIGLLTWIVATVVGIIFLQFGTFNPDAAGLGSTLGPILTFLTAAGLYAILYKKSGKTALKV